MKDLEQYSQTYPMSHEVVFKLTQLKKSIGASFEVWHDTCMHCLLCALHGDAVVECHCEWDTLTHVTHLCEGRVRGGHCA